MLKYYLVCFKDNIENLINDDDIYFDGDDLNEDVDSVFEIFAENEEEAKEKYLRMSAHVTYEKKGRLELIKRECAARVIRRIVSGELFMLPREVIASKEFGQIVTMVYDAVSKPAQGNIYLSIELARKFAKDINLDCLAELISKEAVIALYIELYEKDVFVQELQLYLN